MGQHDRSLGEIRLACSYDPHSLIIRVWKGISLRLAGRSEEALKVCLKTLDQDPHFSLAHWVLGLAYQETGDLRLALAEFESAAQLSGTNPAMLSALGHVQAFSGKRKQALETLRRLQMLSAKRYVAAYDIAMVCVGLREEEEALTFFEKAFEERSTWVVTLPVEPRVAALKRNTRFMALVSKLGLPHNSAISI